MTEKKTAEVTSVKGKPPLMAQFISCSSLPDGQWRKPSHHKSELMQAPNSGQLHKKTKFFLMKPLGVVVLPVGTFWWADHEQGGWQQEFGVFGNFHPGQDEVARFPLQEFDDETARVARLYLPVGEDVPTVRKHFHDVVVVVLIKRADDVYLLVFVVGGVDDDAVLCRAFGRVFRFCPFHLQAKWVSALPSAKKWTLFCQIRSNCQFSNLASYLGKIRQFDVIDVFVCQLEKKYLLDVTDTLICQLGRICQSYVICLLDMIDTLFSSRLEHSFF